jgi:hypothetical protein
MAPWKRKDGGIRDFNLKLLEAEGHQAFPGINSGNLFLQVDV